MNTLGSPDDSDYLEVLDSSEILPDNRNKKMTLLTFKTWITNAFTLPNHKNTHAVGGTDAFLITDLIDAIARFRVKIGNVLTGTRRGINFIPGTNVTITTLDDGSNDQVNVTINATGSGSGDVTNGNNLGTQEEVFVNKTTGILNFKTIGGSSTISVTSNTNEITVDSIPLNYTPNKILIGNNTTGIIESYNDLERIPGIGLKYTGEAFFNDGVPPTPDYIFDIQKKTIDQLGNTGSTGAFQVDAEGAYYFRQFRKQSSPNALIYENHFIRLDNIGVGEGISLKAFSSFTPLGSNIIQERGGSVGLGNSSYTIVGISNCALGVDNSSVKIPALTVGFDNFSGVKEYLEFYNFIYNPNGFTSSYFHISLQKRNNGLNVGENTPSLKINSNEFVLGLGNDLTGGVNENATTYTFTDKGIVFVPVIPGTALNNSLFLDSITGKLSFKDSLGVVNALY